MSVLARPSAHALVRARALWAGADGGFRAQGSGPGVFWKVTRSFPRGVASSFPEKFPETSPEEFPKSVPESAPDFSRILTQAF